ncbi:hemerythrin domain-containing protein [Nocardia takedensis]
MRNVHARLRTTLVHTRATLDADDPTAASRDLLTHCHTFCVALTSHHEAEDHTLFPVLAAAYPDLRDTIRNLEQDHAMIAHLLTELQSAVHTSVTPADLDFHLEGIAAIMENHFRYEERQLLAILDTLDLDSDTVPGSL